MDFRHEHGIACDLISLQIYDIQFQPTTDRMIDLILMDWIDIVLIWCNEW